MKNTIFLLLAIFYIGCSSKGVNIYIPIKEVKNYSNINVYDKRENREVLGYIYSKNQAVEDITISFDIKKLIKSEIAKLDIKTKVDIFIKKLSISYDKSKLTKTNAKGLFEAEVIIYKNGKVVTRFIKVEEEIWINPINRYKKLEEFSKRVIFEGIKQIKKVLK